MARNLFGGTPADVAEDAAGVRAPGAIGTVWDGEGESATQITDLTDQARGQITNLTANANGMVPAFYGPDDVERVWVDFGAGRVSMVATDTGERFKAHVAADDPHGDRQAILGLLGTPTGIATLGTDGRVRPEQLPEFATGDQLVSSVNGYVGDVELNAETVGASPLGHTHTSADVGALPITGGTVDGSITTTGTSTFTNLRLGTASTGLAGGNGSIIAMSDATTIPNATPSSVVQYAEGGRLKVRQRDGQIITPANMSGTWQPDDYGLTSWAYDLMASSRTPGDMPSEAGRVYFVGVPVRATTVVSQVACHVMGFDKPNSTVTSAYMGIYDKNLTRLGITASLVTAFPEVHNIGGRMASFPLANSLSLAPGSYYIAILVKGAGTTVPYLASTNWTGTSTTSGAEAADLNGVHRWLQTSSTTFTTLPTTITLADMADSTTCYWAGLG